MPYFASDFADWLDEELAASRRVLQRVLVRTEALAALRSRAFDLSAESKRPISPDDLFGSARTERERAELQVLADLVLNTRDETGLDDRESERTHADTGAGF
jgi:hypothetical protein